MSWIPWIAWLAAIVVGVVVLGFCAYEVSWKARRLQRDLLGLQKLGGQATELQAGLAAVQTRAADIGAG